MYDYDYEEYYEPTVAEEIMIEASEKLKEALKESAKSYIDSILKQNEQLKASNLELKKFVDEVESIKRELQLEKTNIERNVRRAKLSELMKNFEVELYRIDYEWIKKEKCDICNEKRNVIFLSPQRYK